MHCEFTYTINLFQDESWDLSNFICYEGSLIYIFIKLINLMIYNLYFISENPHEAGALLK